LTRLVLSYYVWVPMHRSIHLGPNLTSVASSFMLKVLIVSHSDEFDKKQLNTCKQTFPSKVATSIWFVWRYGTVPNKMTAHHHFPLFDGYNWGWIPHFQTNPAGGWSGRESQLDFSPVYSKLVKLCTPRLAKNWIFLHQSAWKTVGMFFENLNVHSAATVALHCKTVLCPLCSNGFKWVDQKLICNPSVHTKLIWIFIPLWFYML